MSRLDIDNTFCQAGNKHGDGTMSWPWGDVYVGRFAEGQIVGPGLYKWSNGATFNGTFESGYTKSGNLTYDDGLFKQENLDKPSMLMNVNSDGHSSFYHSFQIGVHFDDISTWYSGVTHNRQSTLKIIGPIIGKDVVEFQYLSFFLFYLIFYQKNFQ